MKKILLALLLLLGTTFILSSAAEAETPDLTPEEKGLAIAKEAEKRTNGFGDMSAEMVMTLKNRHNKESKRNLRIKTLEVDGDGDKSISIFDNPRDVKGTAFLTYSHKEGDDDQWLYLPALKRVKRISSSSKSGSFMGSEFSYEDLSSQEVEKYTHKWLRDEEYNGQDCFVTELDPVHPKSGYSRQVVWQDKKEYRTLKVEYYDRKNAHLKTLVMDGYVKYLDRFWQPAEMNVTNHTNGKSTRLEWKEYRFRTGLRAKDFTKNALKRAR
ncbi:MAG: outer membrane lipoprotein-sorting protein [Proteobacteria bacterium]|nr:outer membrane lipoprotein-sorting protein [Pseudomonadota bacterium]